MKNFIDRCLDHSGKGLDKWMCYLPEYERLLSEFRERPLSLLEIGVQNGGSLEVYSQYFAHAHVLVGCDIDPKCGDLVFADPRIHVVVGDATSDAAEAAITAISDRYDIVIDDGSHQSGHIVKGFSRYFKLLNEGGVYIAEDLHCSYWKEFEGGLSFPYSSMSFFKQLADIVNYEHWGIAGPRSDVLNRFNLRYGVTFDESMLAAIHSVEFSNSVCVIHKRPSEQNRRGQRVLTGSIFDVEPQAPTASEQVSSAEMFPQGNHFLSAMRTPEECASQIVQLEEANEALAAQSAERASRVVQLEEANEALAVQLSERTHRVESLENSTSWWITRPLRLVNTGLRRLLSR